MGNDSESLREKLLRELGQEDSARKSPSAALLSFDYLNEVSDGDLRRVGIDIAAFFAIQGQWSEALKLIQRVRALDAANASALVFEMRCLYELENFTEVLALGQKPVSEKYHLLSANYLMALSFEALEMFPQARARYEAVIKQNSNFLDATLRLSRLQGISPRS